MREIKFRGISYLTNDWEYGYLSKRESLYYIKNTYNVKENTIGQFTGLKDKNGVEIYEGDILQWISSNPFSLGELRKVKVNYVQAQFWCQGTIGVYLAELLANEKCEVIGNIYEHPNLLNNE